MYFVIKLTRLGNDTKCILWALRITNSYILMHKKWPLVVVPAIYSHLLSYYTKFMNYIQIHCMCSAKGQKLTYDNLLTSCTLQLNLNHPSHFHSFLTQLVFVKIMSFVVSSKYNTIKGATALPPLPQPIIIILKFAKQFWFIN